MKDLYRTALKRAIQLEKAGRKRLSNRHRSFKAQETAENLTVAPTRQITDTMVPSGGQRVDKRELRLDITNVLNENEADILALMLGAVKMSESETVVRIAGGWVRDKLLGLQV